MPNNAIFPNKEILGSINPANETTKFPSWMNNRCTFTKQLKAISFFLLTLVFCVSLFLFTTPPAIYAQRADIPVTKKVMVIDFNPILESRNNVRLRTYQNWYDPVYLENQIISELRSISGGYVNYQITLRVPNIDAYPIKQDGFQYTDESYLACIANETTCHRPDIIDYLKVLNDYQVCERRNRGEIDELWLWGAPWFGYAESRLTGPGAFWYNWEPLTGSTCQKLLPIMGYAYHTTFDYQIHDYTHRVEATLYHLYGSSYWPYNTNIINPRLNAWERFVAIEKTAPTNSGCGFSHYAPNSTRDYEHDNTTVVLSNCDDWKNYPNLLGTKLQMDCTPWGCTGDRYYSWWLSNIPHFLGVAPDGKRNNWWSYVVDWEAAVLTATPTPSPTPSPTPASKPGDANGDNIVDGVDYMVWLVNYNMTTPGGVSKGDFNADGKIDLLDYSIWLNNFF